MHTVADVYCVGCNERLGWYYVKASDASQKYKEGMSIAYLYPLVWMFLLIMVPGKYLLERAKIVKDNVWRLDDDDF